MDIRDYMAIVNLIHRYPELLDQGNVDDLADLFKDADFYKPNELFSKDAAGLRGYWREWVRSLSARWPAPHLSAHLGKPAPAS